MRIVQTLILSTFILLFSIEAGATHIVGGVINYVYNGNGNYTFTMRIYRDCTSSTQFDGAVGSSTPAALVSIFPDNSTISVLDFQLTNPAVQSVNPPINNQCLVIPPNVCVEEGTYTWNANIPNGNVGYYVVYERCCRNGSINNLLNPGAQGGTYWAYIPPRNTQGNNSNPVFNNFPPLFICQNAPLLFNHSATDPDGDSLVYELCDPFQGASQASPAPAPSAPPFTNVQFTGAYNAQDPLGPPVALSIDPNTGILTGTPGTIGQFVVGVCVREYRNGQLLSTTLRDFQFNVTNCNIPIARIPSININPNTGIGDFFVSCNTLDVNFVNQSAGAVSYRWNFGDPTTQADTSNLTNPSYTYPDTGTYLVTLIAINAQGCADTTYAFVQLYPFLNVNFTGADVCLGESIGFQDSTVFTAGQINTWAWNMGDGTFYNTQNVNHTYAAPGTYTVVLSVTTNRGCNDQFTRTYTVHPQPNMSYTPPNPKCVGEPLNFTNTSTGGPTTYSWSFGDGTGSALQNPVKTYNNSGPFNITFVGSTQFGCVDTLRNVLVVDPLPTVTMGDDTLVCPFEPVPLSAAGGVSYTWSPAATLNNSNIANPVATPTGNITYTVTVTDGNQCQNTGTQSVTWLPIPPIDAGLDTSVCLNPSPFRFRDSVLLSATGGFNYTWSPPTGLNTTNGANPLAKPPNTITYYVTGVDTNGCFNTDSVLVVVLDPSLDLILETDTAICQGDSTLLTIADQGTITQYIWNPNLFLSDDSTRSPFFFPQDTQDYILYVENYCYTKEDTVTINILPLPSISTTRLDSICFGESYQMSVSGGQFYFWDFDPTLSATNIADPVATPIVNTEYFVTVTDTFGCSSRDSITILVYLLPNIQIGFVPDYICRGDSLELTATGGINYSWSPANQTLNPNLATTLAIPLDTTNFIVEGDNIHGCINYDSVRVNVQQPVRATAEPDTMICAGEDVRLLATGGTYYLWEPDLYLSTPNVPSPMATPQASINYVVTVSNDCFFDTAQVLINALPLPVVDAGMDTTIFRELSAQLEATGALDYAWTPFDGLDDPFVFDPVASPLNTIIYYVTGTDAFGCEATDSVTVFIDPFTVLLVPTGFSPNGDGTNDLFGIVRHLNIKTIIDFKVYNRWGEEVWQGDDFDDRWDGTYDGKPLPLSTYGWYITALDFDNNSVVRKGNVTLLR